MPNTNQFRRNPMRRAAVCGTLIALCLFGQNTTLRTTVPLVVLPASVTDKQGRPIYGLTASDFVLTDDGKARGFHLDVIDEGLAPVALVVLIQTTDRSIYALTYSSYLTPWTTKASDYSPGAPAFIAGINDLLRLSKRNTVQALTSETGGRRMGFETKSKLTNDLIALGTDIHSHYFLSFTPETGAASPFSMRGS